MEIPGNLSYTEDHEWVLTVRPGVTRIGITDYAQDQLGDVVHVEMPAVGTVVASGDLVLEIESTKSVGEIYAPVAGQVVTVNEALSNSPNLINTSPYGDGWLVEVAVDDGHVTERLLDAAAYRDLTE